MEKLNFSVNINAPKEKIWNILWEDASYRIWTTPFCEGSYAVSDWKEGSKVLFLSPDGSGMVSKVAVKRPNAYMSFEHLGEVKNGIEDTTSELVKQWQGSTENYTLEATKEGTLLKVDMDTSEGFKEYLQKAWPLALNKLKELAERN
ncbi:hypothetical protein BH10BAC2_BH10BAC2_38700 [soil metagenome]